MLVLEWNNPKIAISEIESYLRNYLGDNYDGITIADAKMSILTHDVLNEEQEDSIKSWFYTINNIPNTVKLDVPTQDGKPMFVRSMTESNWHYSSHAMDFYTAKHGSLYNRECDGFTVEDTSDAGDAELLFFDANGNLLTQNYEEDDTAYQERLSQVCTKTCLWWEKPHEYDIAGAYFYIEKNPTNPAYLWVMAAPHIPREYGGRVPFMGRGMNLRMMDAKAVHTFFAESCVRIKYDPENHSGKLGAEVLHAPGEQIGLQIIYIIYEE